MRNARSRHLSTPLPRLLSQVMKYRLQVSVSSLQRLVPLVRVVTLAREKPSVLQQPALLSSVLQRPLRTRLNKLSFVLSNDRSLGRSFVFSVPHLDFMHFLSSCDRMRPGLETSGVAIRWLVE